MSSHSLKTNALTRKFRVSKNEPQVEVKEIPETPIEETPTIHEIKKRPRLDLGAVPGGGRERKRGKSMFGILVGTLNKAKIEDKERNASDAVSYCRGSTLSVLSNNGLFRLKSDN